MPKCCVEGCLNEAGVPGTAKGLCRAHYKRLYRYGDVSAEPRRVYSWKGEICAESGCASPVKINGLCGNHYALVRRRNDPEGNRRRQLAWRQRQIAKQEADLGRPRPMLCEICNEKGDGRKTPIVFDHCHKSGKARGWLCDRCNKVLGLVYDRTSLLLEMALYLERHNGEVDDATQKRSS